MHVKNIQKKRGVQKEMQRDWRISWGPYAITQEISWNSDIYPTKVWYDMVSFNHGPKKATL